MSKYQEWRKHNLKHSDWHWRALVSGILTPYRIIYNMMKGLPLRYCLKKEFTTDYHNTTFTYSKDDKELKI